MGARTIRKAAKAANGKQESRVMAVTISAVAVPFLLTFVLIAMDMRPSLSETRGGGRTSEDGSELVGWGDLPNIKGDRRARMLGYMMDSYKPVPNETPVMTFFLLPDAGELLHPAHREPPQMVEVWLRDGEPTRYSDRSLVWVTGALRRVKKKDRDEDPWWALTDATLAPAAEHDIRFWFVQ